jgi:hypothetical protein
MIPSTTFEWLTWKLIKNLRSRGRAGTGRVCLAKIAEAPQREENRPYRLCALSHILPRLARGIVKIIQDLRRNT